MFCLNKKSRIVLCKQCFFILAESFFVEFLVVFFNTFLYFLVRILSLYFFFCTCWVFYITFWPLPHSRPDSIQCTIRDAVEWVSWSFLSDLVSVNSICVTSSVSNFQADTLITPTQIWNVKQIDGNNKYFQYTFLAKHNRSCLLYTSRCV